jgi:three-Cys-motif partner protein
MSPIPFVPDEIGPWSEIKLEIIEKYGPAYTKAFAGEKGRNLKRYYVDGFSGAGLHVAKKGKHVIEGSPARALKVAPPFDGFFFIDMNKDKTDYLAQQCGGRSDVTILTGDCNEHLMNTVFPKIKYELYTRALCLLDPYGMHLSWDVIKQAGQSRAIDMFLNFPIMDINRNALTRNPDKAAPENLERMNRLWGDASWRDIAYVKSDQHSLFGDPPELLKQDNETIAKAFRQRLREVAGFAYVPEPIPMRNKNNAVLYYLFFAAAHPTADKIIKDIFAKYRG